MTILNINIDEKKKKEINELVKKREFRSISQFIRLGIDEKLIIEKVLNKKQEDIEIPDWIPDGKYVAFVNNAITSIGDSPQQVSHESAQKFPDGNCVIIKRKGKPTKNFEYLFSTFSELKCWKYEVLHEKTYPLIIVQIGKDDKFTYVKGLPDSAASLSLIKSEFSQELGLEKVRTETVYTAKGIVEMDIVNATIKLDDLIFKADFFKSEIPEELPFKLLIGRNVLDKLDFYLFGKNQIVCYKYP